ncbi:hypothetical protein Poli38472_000402 [Pythium oligandrum]|uniref:non-specific serine/threonine protein kinase n=1 Tax=Pythium oligandrum TaxID=41045 RepID=A0A8K1FEB6_PYTOL|nr:hypothetical protein Poli38472_000402 [Pythium oligandrum]|eukprot:TMW60360.1 hypothetical protein Poli38472_000402 [Pythium oligandrum]
MNSVKMAAPPPVLQFDAAPEVGDFFFGTVLGQGSYAKVFHAKMKKNNMEFAIKVMDQNFIRKENKAAFVLTERRVLSRLHHPNIVRFYCSFKDTQSLYLVMELCKGGDLFSLIKTEATRNRDLGVKDTACSLQLTQFYTAEIVAALEYMHSKRVVHRDLKPDNLLLSSCGHLKVTDFGTAKDQDDKEVGNQFCGTVSYVSPEVLHDSPANRPCDLWALGCIVYQMLTGRLPFVAENDYLTFQLIISHSNDQLDFPESIPEAARDLIEKLLVQEPAARLGAAQDENGYAELRNHPFFAGIDWELLHEQTPPFSPPELELAEPRLDGALEHWSVAEYFADDAFSESTDERLSSMSSSYTSRRSRSCSSLRFGKMSCMSADEQVRLEAKVKVHSAMLGRTRQVILTDTPRLIILSSWSGKFKRDVYLPKDTRITPLGPNTFEVVTPAGTFRITDATNSAQTWVRSIAEAIHNANASRSHLPSFDQ